MKRDYHAYGCGTILNLKILVIKLHTNSEDILVDIYKYKKNAVI